uniref:CCHC-type domain-containing protein n=1 Tax=Tanacetum cinerariifolium TaxID=118510 RepID=A0A6L2MLI8_TANCI|nr:hypothetical protein [Tanacetum cinerariifolium]
MVDDNVGNQVRQNDVRNDGNEVGQNAVQNPAPAEGNGNGINGNSIRCYNYRGEGHYASNCTVKPRKRDAAYLQQQLQIAQEEEAWIQSTQKKFEFLAAADAYEETKSKNGSAKVSKDENCYDHDIFNMLTQEVQVNNTAKTRRPHPRSNSNTDIVPSESKSSCLSNNIEKIEENHRNS